MSDCLSSAGTGVDRICSTRRSSDEVSTWSAPGSVRSTRSLDEVPVRTEIVGHAPGTLVDTEPVEFAQFDQRSTTVDQTSGGLGVVEETVEQVVPLLFEGEAALELVEHREPGWQPRLDREVEQDPPSERVQRTDRCVVEAGEGLAGVRPAVSFEALAGASAQLGGRLLGEGDGSDCRDRNTRSNEVDDPGHERAGLPGAGAGLDEQRCIQIGADAQPFGLVGRCRRGWVGDRWIGGRFHHDSSCRPNHSARRGSCCLRVHSAQRSAVPRPSGSQ